MTGDQRSFLTEARHMGAGHVTLFVGDLGHDADLPTVGALQWRRDGKGVVHRAYFALLCLLVALPWFALAGSGVPAITMTSFEGSYHFFAIALTCCSVTAL